jgi:mercuric ion binding protein
MKARVGMFTALGVVLASLVAQAGEAKVVLDVHHAYCQVCPSIVKKTLEQVKGVTAVTVGQADADGNMAATITYDDAQGSPATMIKASTDRGYPAEVAKGAKS